MHEPVDPREHVIRFQPLGSLRPAGGGAGSQHAWLPVRVVGDVDSSTTHIGGGSTPCQLECSTPCQLEDAWMGLGDRASAIQRFFI